MDKSQLARRIADIYPQLKPKDAERMVKVVLDALCGALARGRRIEIRGFGSFSLNRLPQKQKRSLRDGYRMIESAKYIPHFKPARELCARISKNNGAGVVEICRLDGHGSPDLSIHDVANDMERTAVYA